MAHHGTNGQFDASKTFTLKGVVTDIAYVNPHAYVYLDVADENGNVVNWNCELRSASVLNRSGWKKEMFATGTQVEIFGAAARRDPAGCYLETISFNGGPVIERYAQIEEGQLQPEADRPALTPWGVPYIGGDWAAEQRLIGAITGPDAMAMGGPARGGGVALTEAGQAARDANIQEDDNVTGRLDCEPRDFFRDWVFDQIPNGIYQEEDKIVLKYGFMSTERTIHLDMDEHPADLEPNWAGHSIGTWEDELTTESHRFSIKALVDDYAVYRDSLNAHGYANLFAEEDENNASGVHYFTLYTGTKGEDHEEGAAVNITSFTVMGKYHDEYVLTDEGWKFASRSVEAVFRPE
eukprot:g4498.t1